jgi:hypothetical protein
MTARTFTERDMVVAFLAACKDGGADPGRLKEAMSSMIAPKGLTRLELYAHPEDHASIKALAAKLQRKRMKDKRNER